MSWRVACVLVLVSTAHAEKPLARPEAIQVDRDEAPAGRTELGFDGGAPLAGWGATIGFGWLEQPIAYGALGGAIALGTSIVVDARIAAAHQIGDRLGTSALDKWVSTDLHAGGRIHVAGNATRSVFVRVDATLPTGDDGDFAGEASWSLAWRIVGRLDLERVVLAASGGIRLRGREVIVGDRLVGDEGVLAAGVVVPVPALQPLWCSEGLKLSGEVVGVVGNDVGMGTGPSPAEARFGVIGRPTPELTIGARAGFGLNDQIGAPQFRATLELTYAR
jgi:hypothetical protein